MSASTAIAPRYSFVQLQDPAEADCAFGPGVCLPMSSISNISFQMYLVNGATPVGGVTRTIYANPVPTTFDCDAAVRIDEDLQVAMHGEIANFSGGAYTTVVNFFMDAASWDTWNVGEPTERKVLQGECFRFQIIEDWRDGGDIVIAREVIGCTNCFVRVEASCFLSVLQYSCDENSFGFNYLADLYGSSFSNIVELPFYLHSPQMKDDKMVYEKGNGEIVKLKERIGEEWTLETDWLPYWWHKPLNVGLAHDTVLIVNTYIQQVDPFNYNTDFVKTGDYEIAHEKQLPYKQAKAECIMANGSPVHLLNSNCRG